MPYLPDVREYRAMAVEAEPIETREAGEQPSGMKVRGLFTTYNDPYMLYSMNVDGTRVEVWEQVAPGAFDEADKKDVIMQYNHEGHVYARISNGTLSLFDEERGAGMVAELSGTTIGRQLYEEIAGGYTREMSMGFTILDRSEAREWINEGEPGETLKIMNTLNRVKKLYDVSAVAIPANPGTEIMPLTRSAYLNGEIEQARKEIAEKREMDKKRKMLALKLKLMEVEANEH